MEAINIFEVNVKFVVQATDMWKLWDELNANKILHPIRFIDIKVIDFIPPTEGAK